MEVAHSEHDLGSNELYGVFWETLNLEDIVVNVSTWVVVEEEVDPQLILKNEVHWINEWVGRLEEDLLFVADVLNLLFFD